MAGLPRKGPQHGGCTKLGHLGHPAAHHAWLSKTRRRMCRSNARRANSPHLVPQVLPMAMAQQRCWVGMAKSYLHLMTHYSYCSKTLCVISANNQHHSEYDRQSV